MKRMKKTLSVFMALIICALCLSVSASAFEPSDLSFEILPDDTAVLLSCDKSASGIVNVPSVVTVNGTAYTVTYVADYAFEGCEDVTVVKFSEGLEKVGAYVFKDCKSLCDVFIPKSIVSCDLNAFSMSNNITLHFYSDSYQLFAVYAVNSNIKLDLLDTESEDLLGTGTYINLTNLIFEIIKKVLLTYLKLVMGIFG